MSGTRLRLAPIVLEAFFVVLGVSLALAGSEWRARMADRDRAEHARVSILEEIRGNRDAVAASRAYHAGLMDSLSTRMAPGSVPPSMNVFREGFIRPTTALSTAWDAARATGAITNMDYEDVLVFSKLYAMQARYERSALEAGTVLYSEIMDVGVPGVAANYRNLSYIISGFWYLEGALLDEYDRTLAHFDPSGAIPSGADSSDVVPEVPPQEGSRQPDE